MYAIRSYYAFDHLPGVRLFFQGHAVGAFHGPAAALQADHQPQVVHRLGVVQRLVAVDLPVQVELEQALVVGHGALHRVLLHGGAHLVELASYNFV